MHIARSKPLDGVKVGDTSLTGQATARPVEPGSGPKVRWEKVLSVRAAIACGRYNISSDALAEKMLAELRDDAPAEAPPFDATKRHR